MRTVRVKCVGVSPLLLNPKTPEVIRELREGIGGRRRPALPDTPLSTRAEKKLLKDSQGRLGFPARYIFANLREAGRYVQYDTKRKISTKEETLLPIFLRVIGDFFPFAEDCQAWEVDEDMGRPDPTKPMMPIIRPRFDKWAFEMVLEFDEKLIAEEKIKQLVEMGGRLGLGAFRQKGPYGRYKIAENGWQVDGR